MTIDTSRQDRNETIRMALLAALGHHKPDYRSVGRLDKSAKVLADFVIGALDELHGNGENTNTDLSGRINPQ